MAKAKKTENPNAGSGNDQTPLTNPSLATTPPEGVNLRPNGAAAAALEEATPPLDRDSLHAPGEEMSLNEMKDELERIALEENLDSKVDDLLSFVESIGKTVTWIHSHEDISLQCKAAPILGNMRTKVTCTIAKTRLPD